MKTITFLFFLAVGTAAHATVWRVNNNPGQSQSTSSGQQVFNNLQTAISSNLVEIGDTLYVEPSSVSYGEVIINKPLHLIGNGYFLNQNLELQQNILTSTVRTVTFGPGSDGSSLEGLYLFAGSNTSVSFSNTPLNNITISRCYGVNISFTNNSSNAINNVIIKGCYLNGLGISSNTAAISNLVLTNNRFDYLNMTNSVTATISNNIIEDNFNINGQPFFNNIVLGTAASDFTQNSNSVTNVYNNLFILPQPSWFTGNTNNTFGLTTNYIFANYTNPSTDGKFQLKPDGQCNECYDGFPANTQVGIFGGSDPYRLSGIPPIPSIYLLQHPVNAPQSGAIDITISTRTNN